MAIRNPLPIKPRVKDAREYEQAVRRAYFDPFIRRIQAKLATAVAVNEVWRGMDTALAETVAAGVPAELIAAELAKIDGYHRERLKASFRAALGVDVRPFLTRPEVVSYMRQVVSDNVDLIRTIPPRYHEGLKGRLEKELREAPFDQQRLTKIMREEYRSSGYNLRRIVRDQNQKLVGGLNRVRHGQLGIERYQWLTSQDERVRPTHQANSGRIFEWANPPAETGHPSSDVNCRCLSTPIVTQAQYDKWKGVGGPTSITGIGLS